METSVVDRIVEKFGTQELLAEAIGADQSTIAHWKRRGDIIPARQQRKILEAARKRKIDLSPSDFFASPEAAA